MIRKFIAFVALALTASLSQALIMNWTVLNDARYCDSYAYVQLVAVNTGAADAEHPAELYSWWMELDSKGLSEAFKGDESYSALNLEEYMTLRADNEADDAIGYMSSFGYDGGDQPAYFNFTGYSFYFRMLDEDGNVIANSNTTGPCGSTYTGPRPWDDDIYEQYVLDAGHLQPTVWVVGVPEPCSAALLLLGVSALLLRRRTA